MKTALSLLAMLALSAGPALAADSALVNRLTWGLSGPAPDGSNRDWLDRQLHPTADDGLPADIQAGIDAMEISQKDAAAISAELRDLRQAAQRVKGSPDYDAAQKAYQQKLNDLWRQAQTRSLLRDIYSQNQLKEMLTWFWVNHFSVHAPKGEIRGLVADYEDQAIRPHVLGKFRDLLAATMLHPAMLQYLDNAQNAKGHINENYAREIMELHTMGVGSGYTQKDVQELARVLTGLGVDLSGKPRNDGHLTFFFPQRHDFGDKQFLGTSIRGSGVNEIATAAAILAAEPATAAFVSRKLAEYFCCDAPSAKLLAAMTATWKRSDGDIAEVLQTLFASEEFRASLGRKFKDPLQWTVSAVRASFGTREIVNVQPMLNWLNRLGEPLYGHETPDGYPLTEAAWAGPGQMTARFEIARQIGAGAPTLFRSPDAPPERAAPPQLDATPLYVSFSGTSRDAIAQGAALPDRNMLFLSSPEFMRR